MHISNPRSYHLNRYDGTRQNKSVLINEIFVYLSCWLISKNFNRIFEVFVHYNKNNNAAKPIN